MQTKWKPAFIPEYRPPRGGWTIRTMPEIFPENLRQLWEVRTKASNRNGNDAVVEMLTMLQRNGVTVTMEIRKEIETQALNEWCDAEPSRCRKRATVSKAGAPRPVADVQVKIVGVHVTTTRPRAVASSPRRKCCGQ